MFHSTDSRQPSSTTSVQEFEEDSISTTATEVNTSRPMSPGKTAEIRSRYMEQLQQVKVLHDEGVLNQEEYEEQKRISIG